MCSLVPTSHPDIEPKVREGWKAAVEGRRIKLLSDRELSQ